MEQDFFQFGRVSKIIVAMVEDTKKVLVNGAEYMSYSKDDDETQRLAIVQLCESGVGTQEEVAQAFNIHPNSVTNYLSRFREDGLRGLLTKQRGPQEPWKLTPQRRWKILESAFRQGTNNCARICQSLKQDWNEDLSEDSIRLVLIENGFFAKKEQRQDYEQSEFKFDGQLELRFTKPAVREAIADKKDCGEETKIEKAVSALKRSNYSQAERIYLDQLEQGQYSAYAGGLLFVPLLQQYSFLPIIKQTINVETYEGYSLGQLCLTLFYFDLFRFQSMEDFKTVYPEEFGLLVGKSSSPSIFTLRRFLHKVRELKKGEELIDEFALLYLKKGIARWGALYIDGHFLPYYGIYPITMGWHAVRKVPMKGSYNFLAVDWELYSKIDPLRSKII